MDARTAATGGHQTDMVRAPKVGDHMTRLMRDSTNWQAIPVGTPIVAGYVPPSGFAWPELAWAKFAGSLLVRITPQVSTTGVGIQVLDVETGDATPGQAPSWAVAQRRLGQVPTIYCSASSWGTVQHAFTSAGVAQPEYWVASYPGGGSQSLPVLNGITAVAHQYADPATSGGDWDLSVVADYWPGVDAGGIMELTDSVPTSYGSTTLGQLFSDLAEFMPGVASKHPQGGTWTYLQEQRNALIAAEVKTDTDIQAAVTAEQAALLAAIQANAASVDATKLAAALDAAGLPQQLVSAFVAVLAKATGA